MYYRPLTGDGVLNGTLIRHLRLTAGRSERDFIAACRLTYAALHKIEERGGGRTSTITLGQIERMAAELGVSPAALFRRDEATDEASPDTRLLGGVLYASRRDPHVHDLATALGWTLDRVHAAVRACSETVVSH